jgi:signal transduction histidine kinase
VDTREPGTLDGASRLGISSEVAQRLIDCGLAALVTAAALGYAVFAMQPTPDWPALVACAVLTGSIAGWRSHPTAAAAIAVSALLVANSTTAQPPPAPVVLAPVLIFYSLGRSTRHASDRRRVVTLTTLLGYGLVVSVISRHTAGVSGIGTWLGFLLLPVAAGVALASHRELQRRLEAAAAMLQRSATALARRAGGAERDRVARELHDVVAHTVGLMVIQAHAAREVLPRDHQNAREAIAVVSGAGREALAELRRIVGSLPVEEYELGGPAQPSLARLDELIERARAAGLEVDASLDRPMALLAPGVELAGYRILQEALTNTLKHAGPTRTFVRVTIDDDALAIEVTDAGGSGAGPERRSPGEPGHGLTGMHERVAVYRGELSAGPSSGGGYRVHARIPLDDAATRPGGSRPPISDSIETSPRSTGPASRAVRWGWVDPTVGGLLLAGFAAESLSRHRHGPLIVELVALALIPVAAISRKRAPLLLMAVVAALSLPMVWTPTPTGLYALLVPPYTVAAWGGPRQAAVGIGAWAAAASFSGLVTAGDSSVGDILSPIAISAIALAAGLALRGYRLRAEELERANARLASQREDRARMAIADERARIARELHMAIARDVATMVVQAEAAGALLDRDAAGADAALAAIVATGRPALTEMRRIVGVLRHPDLIGAEGPALATGRTQREPERLQALGAQIRSRWPQ